LRLGRPDNGAELPRFADETAERMPIVPVGNPIHGQNRPEKADANRKVLTALFEAIW
jgi:hypothetical protein